MELHYKAGNVKFNMSQFLRLGESKTKEITLPAQHLACWDISKNDWHVERDNIGLNPQVSSADIRL